MARVSGLPALDAGRHAVQFYRADEELAAVVGGYLAEGIRAGDGIVVVTTPTHWRAVEAALSRAGIDADRPRQAGTLLVEDARELLGRLLAGDGLDPGAFQSVTSDLIRRVAAGGRRVRVFGEMVALLWEAGHVTLAIELEALWNGLGALLPFRLLCGYPANVTASGQAADAVREVCGLHSDVIATRSFLPELDSVREARHFATRLLGPAPGGEQLTEDAAIVVTELAANAVLHARSGFTLTLSRSAATIRIAVKDHLPLGAGSGGNSPFDVKVGHGLSVVAQIARRWAVERLPDGKVVWAELAVEQG